MNKEEIDKWLDEEYGCSYTRLEELHNFYFEKYTDLREKNQQLKEAIEEVREYIEDSSKQMSEDATYYLLQILDKVKENKNENN